MRWNYLVRFGALSLPLLATALCPPVSFGVKAGGPLTVELDVFQRANRRRKALDRGADRGASATGATLTGR